jgi:cob(I)alamin adenosyltransferase
VTEQRDPTEVPTEHENPTRRRADGLVIVNTGDGKGKSTAAFGTVMRAVARGWKVAVIQYIKSGNWHVGEEKVCRDQLGVDWWAIGEGFTWESEDLDEDQMVARVAWDHTKAVLAAGDHQMVVLDEITYPINWGWIEVDDVVAAIAGRSAKVNVVITGRDAPAPLVELADTVTEMRKVKHAYDTGVMAKKGIDY